MDREQIEAIRAKRGGAHILGSSQRSGVDARAFATAQAKLRTVFARKPARVLDADALRALAANYRARKGA